MLNEKILIALLLLLLHLLSSHAVLAETLTSDQIEIKTLIKKMYAIDPDTFEYGEFGGKYKNGKVVAEGKYDPKRQCKLLEEFLIKEAIIVVKGVNQGCMTGVNGFFRYPTFDSMDLGSVTRVDPPPQPKIKSPVVVRDKAKVHVTFPKIGANVMYYLRKQPEGWRIYKIESSNNSATIETMDEREGDSIDIFPPEKSVNK